MPGPAPKPASQRQRRNRTATAATIEAAPATKPPLPEGRDWHPRTVATWNAWWESPIAGEWVDAFVPGLLELLELVEDFHRATVAKDRTALRAEIRMSSREYGLSPLAMRGLQWEIKRAEGPAKAPAPRAPRTSRGTRSMLSVLQGRTA